MTDIIFKITSLQPASNVADLNFVDNVISSKLNSKIEVTAQLVFQKLPSRNLKNSIGFEIQPSFAVLLPHAVSAKEMEISIVPAIGFHVVNVGEGDVLFDDVKILCHFDQRENKRGIHNVIDNKTTIFYKDACAVDLDAFDGVVFDEPRDIHNGVVPYYPLTFSFDDFGKSLSIYGNDWCFEARLKFPFDANFDDTGNEFDLFVTKQISCSVIVGIDKFSIALNLSQTSGFSFQWNDIPCEAVSDFTSIKLRCKSGCYELWVDGLLIPISRRYIGETWFSGTNVSYTPKLVDSGAKDTISVNLSVFGSPIAWQYFDTPAIGYKNFLVNNAVPTPEELLVIQSDKNFGKVISSVTHKFYRSKRRAFENKILGTKWRISKNYTDDLKIIFGFSKIVVSKNYIDIFFNTNVVLEESIRVDLPVGIESWFYFDAAVKAVEKGAAYRYNPDYLGDYIHNLHGGILDKTKIGNYLSGDNPPLVDSLPLFLIVNLKNGVLTTTLSSVGIGTSNNQIRLSSVLIGSSTGQQLKNVTFTTPAFEVINDLTSFTIDMDTSHNGDILYYGGITTYSNLHGGYNAPLDAPDLETIYSGAPLYLRKRIDGDLDFVKYALIDDISNDLTGETKPFTSSLLDTAATSTLYLISTPSVNELNTFYNDRDNFELVGEASIVKYAVRREDTNKLTYRFGVDRFAATEKYIEIIFDDTFVEDSHKFYTPFDLVNSCSIDSLGTTTNITNYDAIVSIRKNIFTLNLTNRENGLVTEFEFAATYNKKDLATYDGSTYQLAEFLGTGYTGNGFTGKRENTFEIGSFYKLDEVRLTIGDSIYDDREAPLTNPFPDFIENRIEITPSFTLAATYSFGSNNTIIFDAKAAFKDFTKKPKTTTGTGTPTTTVTSFAAVSTIEVKPAFSTLKIVPLNRVSEISFVVTSSFPLIANLELSVSSTSSFLTGFPVKVCDPLFESVVLLMPCDRFPLVDVMGHTVNVGSSATIDSQKAMFNEGSLSLAGDINSIVTVPSSDFGIRKESVFCIEFWFYPTSSTEYAAIIQFGQPYTDSNGVATRYNWQIATYSGGIAFAVDNSENSIPQLSASTSKNKFNLNQWNHVKVTNEKCLLNGVEFAVGYIARLPNTPSPLCDFTITDVLMIGSKRWKDAPYPTLKLSDIRMTIGSNRSNEKVPPESAYPRISCITHEVPPVKITPIELFGNSAIDFLSSADMNFYTPIRLEKQSEIEFFTELSLKQIKTELIYLAADNRSKASTGFVDKLLEGNGVASIFDGGTIEFYTGNRPYSANHSVTGTLLGELKNIKFGTPINRVIRKDESQTWLLTAISNGQIGWFRIKANVASDYGQDSIREVRLDGEAGIDVAAVNFAVKAGEYYHIQDFAVMWGNG